MLVILFGKEIFSNDTQSMKQKLPIQVTHSGMEIFLIAQQEKQSASMDSIFRENKTLDKATQQLKQLPGIFFMLVFLISTDCKNLAYSKQWGKILVTQLGKVMEKNTRNGDGSAL
jgi:hypothetical protein